jgi:FRG domain
MREIEKSGLTAQNHSHLRVWFRGHSREGWPLKPGVYRGRLEGVSEPDRWNVERHLTQDFLVQSAGLRPGNETDAALYFLQQHYGMPTRLLDWTNNPLAALFFASIADPSSDGELFMLDAYEFQPTVRSFQGRNFIGIATASHPVFESALIPIFRWEPDVFPSFIIPVRPSYSDIRISSQRSCFTFHVPDQSVINSAANPTLNVYRVPMSAKPDIIRELRLLGVDQFRVFGDLSSLSTTLKHDYDV